MNIEEILLPIVTSFDDKGIKKATASINYLENTAKKLRVSTGSLRNSMAELGLQFDKNGEIIRTSGQEIKNQGRALTMLGHASRRFRFEWLSLMFAGMALYRTFGGLIRQQLELWGITELFSGVLAVLFIPLMETLLDPILKFSDWVMNLNPEMQKLVGWFVLGAAVLGFLVMTIGMGALAWGGFIKVIAGVVSAFQGLGPVITAIKGFILGLSGTFLLVAGIIIAVVVGMVLAWKENFMGMRSVVDGFVRAFKQVIGGIIDVVRGVLLIIKGIFTGDMDSIVEGVKRIFSGFWNFLFGGFKVAWNSIVGIIIGAIRIVVGALQAFVNLLGAIPKLWGGKALWKVDWLATVGALRIPTFQEGGIVPRTGLAMLHKGETVLPAGYSPSITIYANVSSDYDVRRLADQLDRYWASKFERITKSRGSI